MTHACGSGANGASLFVPIDIDQDHWGIEPFVDEELTEAKYLFLCQCLFGMGIGTNGSVDVVPEIGCSLTCHTLDVLTGDEFVVVVLANTCGDAEDESCFPTGTDTLQGALINLIGLTASIALGFQSFDADERRDIACFAELLGDFISQERAVGEELEVAVMMPLEDVEESLVHEGFATQDTKEPGAMTLTLEDDTINLLHRQAFPSSPTHPTTATSQIAGLCNGNHVEGGEEWFSSLLPLLKVAHIPQVRPAEVPAELPQQPDRGLSVHPPANFHE